MFKSYTTNDNLLLPPSLGELILSNHPVRIVNRIIESLDIQILLDRYSDKGRSAYHPRLMLKILVFAYLNNHYSSRKIEELCISNIYFMWLTGMQTPDHNTIARFRSSRLKEVLKDVFAGVVKFMVHENLVSLEEVCTDGTKIESTSNRYTFVWGKSIQSRIGKIAEKIETLWKYAESVSHQELSDCPIQSVEDVNVEKVKDAIETINKILKDTRADKKVKQEVRRIAKAWPEQLENYQKQGKILDGRNSFSKTDPDASFMRMKEDHMKNGQLKPAYNVQISTWNQIILNYTIHQTTADTYTYEPHMEEFYRLYERYPCVSVADAGYGSEENYVYAKDKKIETYIKYNYFHKEQQTKWANDPFRSANFYYNSNKDQFYCPMGQPMKKIGEHTKKTQSGFEQTIRTYQALNCKGCSLRCLCHSAKTERKIEINHRLRKIREEERKKLTSERGLLYRSQRPQDVEATFGNLKNNKSFKRFKTRGLKNVETEFGLLSMAHNLSKIAF